jgi:hypothetical protein
MLAWPDSRKMVMARWPQGGHDPRSAGGADLGPVLVVVQVADPVQAVFDGPVAAGDGGEAGRGGLGDGQRGDRVDGLAGPFLPSAEPAPADDLDGLGYVGEGQPSGHGGDFEGAALITPVSPLAGLMGYGDLPPGQGGKLSAQAGLVALDQEGDVHPARDAARSNPFAPVSPWHGGTAPAREWPLRTFLELGALPSAVPCARYHTRQVLWEWHLTEHADSAELVVK